MKIYFDWSSISLLTSKNLYVLTFWPFPLLWIYAVGR